MPFQYEHVFCLVLALTLLSCFPSLPNYEFKVIPVEACPLNKEAWNNSSVRLRCNSTGLYYCLPNTDLTSLIEFCYPRGGRQLFQEGNCLELAGAGYLNHVPCMKTFLSGCPDSFYFGDEIYKYPNCLTINVDLRCFESDTQCINSRQNIIHGRNSTEEQAINITQKTPELSTLQNTTTEWNILFRQNTTTEWNSSEEHLENLTENILECSTIQVGNNTVELNCSIEQKEGVTRTNFKDSSVLVITLSVLLSISVLVLIVVIGTRKFRCRDCKKKTNRPIVKEGLPVADTYDDNSNVPYLMVHEHVPEAETYDEIGPLLDDEEVCRRYPQSGATPPDSEETFEKSYESNSENMTHHQSGGEEYMEFDSGLSKSYMAASGTQKFQAPSDDKSMNEDIYFDSTYGSNQSGEKNFSAPLYDENIDGSIIIGDNECKLLTNAEVSNQSDPQSFSTSICDEDYEKPTDGFPKSSKRCMKHRQRRPLPSLPQTSELRPPPIPERIPIPQLRKPPVPQPRNSIKPQLRDPPKPSHPMKNNHQQVPTAHKTATSEEVDLSAHTAVNGASETSTTLSKVIWGLSTIFGSGLISQHLKLTDENNQPENSPLLKNTSSDQIKKSETGSNMTNEVDTDYSERNDDVMNVQERGKKRFRPRKNRMKRKQWETKQEKTLQMDVYMHHHNWRYRDQIEKEKLDLQCLEKLKLEQFERDKLEKEREDKGSLEQLRWEAEQKRLSVKRPYDSQRGREVFWTEAKRPVVTETRFASKSTFTLDSRDRDQAMDSRESDKSVDDRRARDSFSRDNTPKKRRTVGFERERDRSSTRYDCRNSFKHERSDRRDKDIHWARTLPKHSRGWKSERKIVVMETSLSRDNWQRGGSSSLPNERNVSKMEITFNPEHDSPPNSQRNWDSSADRSKVESSWAASKQRENRILGFQPQDHWNWNNLGLQADTWKQTFGTQITSGHLEARVPVMFLVPQPTGMVLTNTSLAGGQTEPRFDAYKSMQTQFRR